MGYESKLYVARHDKTLNWYEVIAIFNMCKMENSFSSIFTSTVDSDASLYADDGNSLIKEDCYGDALTYTSVPEVLKKLYELQAVEPYRRIPPLIGFLESLVSNFPKYELVAIHYGY